jgi:subtilisin family serine protease
VCAAGNNGDDTDTTPFYPAAYDLDHLISVAATDNTDTLAHWSNYGVSSVDIAAPGVGILSAVPAGAYTATTVFRDEMDSLDAWDPEFYYQENAWELDTSRYVTAPSSAALAPGGGYASGEYAWLMLRESLPLGSADRVLLRFSTRLDARSDDYLMVVGEREDGVPRGLGYLRGSTGGEFKHYESEITYLAGHEGRIAFVLLDMGEDGGEGVWVDDVEIVALVRNSDADYRDAHAYKSGTSMAAPHVAGTAVLLKAADPTLDARQLKEALLYTATPLTSLDGKVLTGARLDAADAVKSVLSTIDLQHDAAGVTFDRWVTGLSTEYSGGGYVYGRWTGTELKATFTGSRVRWVGPKQPSYGMADVYIDDVLVASDVDCYAPAGSATLEPSSGSRARLPTARTPSRSS